VVSTPRWSENVSNIDICDILAVCQSNIFTGNLQTLSPATFNILHTFAQGMGRSGTRAQKRSDPQECATVLRTLAESAYASGYMATQALFGLDVPRCSLNLNISDNRKVAWGDRQGEYAATWMGTETIQVRVDMKTTLAEIKLTYCVSQTHGTGRELAVDLVPAEIRLSYGGETLFEDAVSLGELYIEEDATLSLFVEVGREREHRNRQLLPYMDILFPPSIGGSWTRERTPQ